MKRIAALALVLTAACSPEAVGPRVDKAPPKAATCTRGRTVIVVRHAEKAGEGGADPSLSDKGKARAKALAALLQNAGVTRLVSTPYKRTQETLQPLAEKLKLQVETQKADQTKALVAQLRDAPDGAVVVVATHSNLLPGIVRDLTGTNVRGVEGDLLPEDDFGRVAVIAQPCGAPRASLIELSSNADL